MRAYACAVSKLVVPHICLTPAQAHGVGGHSLQELSSACQALGQKVAESPGDAQLYVKFRMAVREFTAAWRELTNGLSASSLPGAAELDATVGTVDVDLRFLGDAALRKAARDCNAEPEPPSLQESERQATIRVIMRARAVATGYMSSAPPMQPLEHFFDLRKRSGGRYGRSTRRMLRFDFKKRQLITMHKEEEHKAYAFSALKTFDAAGRVVQFTSGGETIEFTAASPAEADNFLALGNRVLAANASKKQPEASASEGQVASWVMSGTVEKEGAVRWSSRWLVLTHTRLYVLRDFMSTSPLNVIPLTSSVGVSSKRAQLSCLGGAVSRLNLVFLDGDAMP